MSQEAAIDAQEAEELHEAMDYAQHQGTWSNFVSMVKWSIYLIAFLVLGLFAFVQVNSPLLGVFFFAVGILSIPAYMLFWPKRA